MCLPNVLALFSKPNFLKFDTTARHTVITEVSSVKGLSLRGNTLRLYRAKHLPLMNWIYGDAGFYSGQTSYLNMKVLIYANFFFNTANLSYGQ